jgi:hypothetical protein
MPPLRRLMEIVREGGTTCKEHHDPHVEFFSSNSEVWKKRYGTLKSPNNEIS